MRTKLISIAFIGPLVFMLNALPIQPSQNHTSSHERKEPFSGKLIANSTEIIQSIPPFVENSGKYPNLLLLWDTFDILRPQYPKVITAATAKSTSTIKILNLLHPFFVVNDINFIDLFDSLLNCVLFLEPIFHVKLWWKMGKVLELWDSRVRSWKCELKIAMQQHCIYNKCWHGRHEICAQRGGKIAFMSIASYGRDSN